MEILDYISTAVSLAGYVLTALGMYTMAKRRGINKPWLAWVPFGNLWLLGCISDQYRHVAKGQVTRRRRSLLTQAGIILGLCVLILGVSASLYVDVQPYLPEELQSVEEIQKLAQMSEEELDEYFEKVELPIGQLTPDLARMVQIKSLLVVVLGVAVAGFAIALVVQMFKAYYDLFLSADPQNAGMFLLWGILENLIAYGILLPVFVFLCRRKDEGMPPRSGQIIDAATEQM